MTATPITVEEIDPASLLVDVNIRTQTTVDKDFTASIRELGVLVPIVAVRTPDGSLRVRHGHRRTLASVETGRASVPVVIVGDDANETERIIGQWHENEHRAGLSTTDKLAAVEQLSLLGLSAAQIVKRTKARKADVEQALAASASPLAKGATARYDFLTLDQASGIAEFETDGETVKALVVAAKSGEGEFAHVLQRARDARAEAAEIAALTEQLATEGTALISRPDHGERSIKSLADLTTPTGGKITPDKHRSCPGHAAFIRTGWHISLVYVCTDWKTHGHLDRYGNNSGRVSGTMDETAKAERREVVANNKAWKSATTVRRNYLTAMLVRKTPPKGSAVYIAGELARGSHALRRAMERTPELAASLLGVESRADRHGIEALADTATDQRALVIALGLVLAAVEDSTGTHTWRNPEPTVGRYLGFLVANGYTLSDVERLAAGTNNKKTRKPSLRMVTGAPATEETVPDTGATSDTGQVDTTG